MTTNIIFVSICILASGALGYLIGAKESAASAPATPTVAPSVADRAATRRTTHPLDPTTRRSPGSEGASALPKERDQDRVIQELTEKNAELTASLKEANVRLATVSVPLPLKPKEPHLGISFEKESRLLAAAKEIQNSIGSRFAIEMKERGESPPRVEAIKEDRDRIRESQRQAFRVELGEDELIRVLRSARDYARSMRNQNPKDTGWKRNFDASITGILLRLYGEDE